MNNKTGVIIGASKDAIHSIQKAKENGIYVVAMDGNPAAEGLSYADYPVNVDISNKEAVCEVMDKIKPDFIMPVPIGRCLTTIGYINERYNLRGIKYKATENGTDKYLFHKKMHDDGLRQIDNFLINKETNIQSIKISYPAIMKPRFGSGSRDIYYIENHEQLFEIYKRIVNKNEDFVLEQFVRGTEYSFDGAVINGSLKITLIRKKINTPLPMRQAISYFSVTRDKENRHILDMVYGHLQKVVNILEFDHCLLQGDLIINDKGVFVVEISPRPTGHYIYNIFAPLVTGIDMAEEYIKFLLGGNCVFESDNIKRMHIRYFDFENVVVNKIPELKALRDSGRCNLRLWNCSIKEGDKMAAVTDGHSIMGRGFFAVEGENEEDLINQSNWILSQFEWEELW